MNMYSERYDIFVVNCTVLANRDVCVTVWHSLTNIYTSYHDVNDLLIVYHWCQCSCHSLLKLMLGIYVAGKLWQQQYTVESVISS